MRIVNHGGRLGLVADGGVIDVETASGGRFGSDVQAIYDQWDDFVAWAAGASTASVTPLDETKLGAPAPMPRQVFAIGLNYIDHALEAKMDVPDAPVVFTKFPTSITGPFDEVELPEGTVDWEVELVVVIGRRARRVQEADGWSHVAGLTMGQDLSERQLQLRPPSPQFSLGKSFPGFAPIGPVLVTVDEFDDRDDIAVSCELNGVEMQSSSTRNLIFSVPSIIARLSSTLPLLPGDVIFTGTPSGIGNSRNPPIFLQPGDQLVTTGSSIGSMRHRFIATT